MNNKIQSTLLFGIIAVLTTTIHADTVLKKLKTENLVYAPACEAVSPQSKLLMTLQKEIQKTPQNKNILLKKFWDEIENNGTPIIEKIDNENSRVIYLWKNAKHNVRLIGGPSNDHEWLTRLKNTDIWFKESIVNNQFIGSYSFAVDLPNIDGYLSNYCAHLNPSLKESRTQRRSVLQVQKLDPFNKKTFIDVESDTTLRNENILKLRNAPKFIDPSRYPNFAQPQVSKFIFESSKLENSRNIYIYKSENKTNQSYITAIFFDGEEYANLLNVPKALDILVKQGKLPPIQAIFVAHPSSTERPKELTPNAKFTEFFNTELLSWIDEHLQQPRDKKKTVLLGSSLGGLSSAYLALQNPNEISHVVPLSGSFWWQEKPSDLPNGMSKIIREKEDQPIQHWYISANTYESSRNNNELSILETSPIVANDLKLKGHDVTYKNYVGGHSYAIWQLILQDAFIHFFKEK